MEASHSNQTTVTGSSRKLVGDVTSWYLEIVLFVVIAGVFAIFGCLTNLANTIVFVKQGFQESTNISLLCLSLSDFGVCLATIGVATTAALEKIDLRQNVDVEAINYICALTWGCFADMSMFTTVFLSLERCLCVVKPLTFKHIITRQKSLTILGVMYTEVVIFRILMWSTNILIWQYNAETNSTRLQMYTLPLGKAVLSVYDIVNGISFTFISMVLVLAASCFMAYGLKKAATFRMSNSASEKSKDSNTVTSSMSTKDAKIVKMVTYVSIMFVVTYLPVIAIMLIRAMYPDVGFMRPQHNLNETFWGIIYASVTINSASNILVYLRVSSRYRATFLTTFFKQFQPSEYSWTTDNM